jgi:hypothetical protein
MRRRGMDIWKTKLVLVLLIVFSNVCLGNIKGNELITATTIKCQIGKGMFTVWDKNGPSMKASTWSKSKEDSTLIFDSIDLKNGTARLIGSGSTDVQAIKISKGITFAEYTGGGINILTVFSKPLTNTQQYPMVYSRHLTLIDPMTSQYNGTCKIVE